MAQEYNVYLRKRLTEFDIIIKNLPYRDGLIIYNKMYLDAMVNYLCLQKFIIGESDTELRMEIDELLERVYNTFSSRAELALDVELASAKPISGQSEMELKTADFEIGEEMFEAFQSLTNLATETLKYDLAKSVGDGSSRFVLKTKAAHTLKTAFEKLHLAPEFLAETEADEEKFAASDTEMTLDTASFDLFYLLGIQGEAVMNLLFSADFEMWYSLGNASHTFYLTATNNGVQSIKYLSCRDFMALIAAVTESLEIFIRTDATDMNLLSGVAAGLKRYRLLSDLDELALSDIDELSLDELDYVELA